MVQLYVAAILANRSNKTEMAPVLFTSPIKDTDEETDVEAKGNAYLIALDEFPPDKGWYGHTYRISRVTDEVIFEYLKQPL